MPWYSFNCLATSKEECHYLAKRNFSVIFQNRVNSTSSLMSRMIVNFYENTEIAFFYWLQNKILLKKVFYRFSISKKRPGWDLKFLNLFHFPHHFTLKILHKNYHHHQWKSNLHSTSLGFISLHNLFNYSMRTIEVLRRLHTDDGESIFHLVRRQFSYRSFINIHHD